jgi:hypothetical protein
MRPDGAAGCFVALLVAVVSIAGNVAWWLWLYPTILRALGWF